MSKNYQRKERDWRRQQRGWQERNPEFDRGEHDYDWRDNDYGPHGQEMSGRWPRGQNIPDQWRSGSNREMSQGSDRGWDRGNEWQRERWQGPPRGQSWEGEYRNLPERPHGRGEAWTNWNEPYEGLGGRGWREGWNEAMHRGGQYAGRGPRGYKRSDSRIEEDINERLTQHPWIDATDVEVTVQNGEVTLRGFVDMRQAKRLAEDIVDSVFGVKEVNNQIKIRERGESEEPTPKQRKVS
jgi:hypothetical protein